MGKVLRIAALTALVVGAAVLTFNPGTGAAIAAALGTSTAVGTAIGATVATVSMSLGTAGLAKNLAKPPGFGLSDLTRLNLTQVAAASRKMVLGDTAFAADLRYDEPSGTDQRFVDAIIHLASHKVTAIRELRIGDKLAWTAAGGVQGEFVGFLTVEVITEAGAGAFHTVNGGFNWGSHTRLTGCATAKIRIDRQGTKRAQSPFAAGLPSQVMFVGEGMPVYDPRRDSTVPGGSGPHRANNQATWAYRDGGTVLGSNLALMALAHKLGWRIGGQVSCGLGQPVSRLDLEAFAAAANACDELVTLAGGGTQRRFHGGGLIPDDADPGTIEQYFADCVGGWWDDGRGRLGLFVAVNDLAGAVLHLADDDILSAATWDPFPTIAEQYNVVRGLNPEPALPTNFQPTEYPEVKIASADGIDRVMSLNLAFIQDKRTPQRLAKQALQRAQYQGLFTATFGTRGWPAKKGHVVRLSFAKLGFVEKLFRVVNRTKNVDGTVNLTLREENAAIYAWAAEESAPVVPATPITYSPLNNPLVITRPEQIGASRTDALAIVPADPSVGDLNKSPATGVVERWDGTAWVPFVEPTGAFTSAAVTATTSGTFVATSGLTLGCGPGGNVRVALAIDYLPSTTLGVASTRMEGALDYRTTPGSGAWVEIATPTLGTIASRAADIAPGEPAENVPGQLMVEATIAGPGTSTNWEFRARQRSTGSTTPSGSGTLGVRVVP